MSQSYARLLSSSRALAKQLNSKQKRSVTQRWNRSSNSSGNGEQWWQQQQQHRGLRTCTAFQPVLCTDEDRRKGSPLSGINTQRLPIALLLQQHQRRSFSSPAPEGASPPPPVPEPTGGKKWATLLRPSEVEIEAIKDNSESALKDLEEEYKLYREARLHPQPHKETELPSSISDIVPSSQKAKGMLARVPVMLKDASMATLRFLWEVLKNPRLLLEKGAALKVSLKEMLQHYWLGSKLLWSDIKTAKKILSRMVSGHSLTRRERKQLLRTASDIFRMVPLAIFLIIPFMEFLLPFALKLFPNMLPSTFQHTLEKEENMKKELRMRLALAGFLQDTVQEMASKKKAAVEGIEGGEAAAVALKELQEFIEKAKLGRIGNDDITRFARLFKDELTLENTSRGQLVSLCKFMGVPPFGGDNFLRYQLRSHLRAITQDDQRILWEGVASLTKQELQEACRERGMRATGLTKEGYRRQLAQWLDLSTAKAVPISLLIMSRAFTLEAPDPASALALSISAMDTDVVTEVMIEAASKEERETASYRAMKLESLERQNELIEQEHRKREEALKKKKAAEAAEAKAKADADKEAAKTSSTEKAETAAVIEAAAAGAAASPSQQQQTEPVTTEAQIVAQGASAGDREVTPASTAAAAAAVADKQKQMQESATAAASASSGSAAVATTAEDKTKSASELTAGSAVAAAVPGAAVVVPPAAAAASAAAAAAPAPAAAGTDAKPKKQREITAEELRALESLTSPSSVSKEKAQLAQMKATLSESMQSAKDGIKQADSKSEADAKKATLVALQAADAQLNAAKSASSAQSNGSSSSNAAAQHAAAAAANAAIAAAAASDTNSSSSSSSGSSKSSTAAAADAAVAAAAEAVSSASSSSGSSSSRGPSEAALNVVEAAAAKLEAVKGHEALQLRAAEEAAAAKRRASDEEVDKSVQRVQNKLASMLDKLELDIQTVEATIGDKFHMLDRDKDGVVGAEELAFVIQHILSSHSTEEEALHIVQKLDADSDGQISVKELIDWVEKYGEAAELDEVFDDLYSMQHPRDDPIKLRSGKKGAKASTAATASSSSSTPGTSS